MLVLRQEDRNQKTYVSFVFLSLCRRHWACDRGIKQCEYILEKILELLSKYNVRMDPSQRNRLADQLTQMAVQSPHYLTSDLAADVVGMKGISDFHVSIMVDRAARHNLRIVSAVELLRFGAEPKWFPAQTARGNRNWHRGGSVLWNDPIGGQVGIQIIQPVEGGVAKPALEFFSEKFPAEGMEVIYLALPK